MVSNMVVLNLSKYCRQYPNKSEVRMFGNYLDYIPQRIDTDCIYFKKVLIPHTEMENLRET